jgi:hypothetical protein
VGGRCEPIASFPEGSPSYSERTAVFADFWDFSISDFQEEAKRLLDSDGLPSLRVKMKGRFFPAEYGWYRAIFLRPM